MQAPVGRGAGGVGLVAIGRPGHRLRDGGPDPDARARARQPAVAAGPPRFVDVAAAAGVEHTYDGDARFFVGGGFAAFDCDDDRRPDLVPRRRRRAGGAVPQHEPSRRRPALRTAGRPGHRPPRRDRRIPARHRRRRHHGPRGPADRRERAAARPRRLPLRARQRALGVRRRIGTGRRPSARPGRATRACPTLAFGNYLALDRDRRRPSRAARDELVPAGVRRGCRLRRSAAPDARPTAPSRCCSATGTDPGGATCGSATTATTTPLRRRGAALADRPGRGADGRTPRTTAGSGADLGAWASPARTSRVTACPRSTSPARATTSSRP